ncbi:hypothetical protein XO10_06195 [Marinitoga sp. 1135]|uniref:hypothetical protein n=1 Tax=Marinitoga sp. 1135 TaxID=1643333 RepID=UPI0015869F12|nr:hypothetical protein [Marinitoga sp. 1135]NUU95867.1 hypothetical protein [Marinitoga sp. 1135]
MNILFISYSIIENDIRTQELLKVIKNFGDVTLVSPVINDNTYIKEVKKHIKLKIKKNEYLTFKNYSRFIFLSLKTAIKTKKIDIFFVDNYLASIPAIFILKFRKSNFVFQDVRELYLLSERKGFRKLLTYSEIKLMKKADLVIAANEYRAKIMKDLYNLFDKPFVFENIRKIEKVYNKDLYDKKYNSYFSNNKFNLIYTGGYEVERKTDLLVKSMINLKNCNLFIVGGGKDEDKRILFNIIDQYKLNNVFLFDKLALDELKYLIDNSHIGIVTYNDDTYNNKYCASGKVYEFLFSKIPIVTSENPPLKELCEKFKIGESNNNFYLAIKKVLDNYDFYKKNVLRYIENISVEKNREKLYLKIRNLINDGG